MVYFVYFVARQLTVKIKGDCFWTVRLKKEVCLFIFEGHNFEFIIDFFVSFNLLAIIGITHFFLIEYSSQYLFFSFCRPRSCFLVKLCFKIVFLILLKVILISYFLSLTIEFAVEVDSLRPCEDLCLQLAYFLYSWPYLHISKCLSFLRN